MAWNEAVVTNSGLELLTRCVLGGSVEITSAVGGESVSPTVSLLAVKEIAGTNHVLQVAKIDRLENGVRVNVRTQNIGLSTGYRLRQIGLFARTAESGETPVLLALIQDRDGEEIPAEEENPEFLLEYDFVIPLSNAENISVSVTPDTFATLDDLEPMNAHIKDKGNPHGVTKAQVGLGNVPDVTTNDQTPTYTVSAALAELVSGEKLGTVTGKLAKAVKELIAHLADNVRHITASERASWNGKANGTHGHSAAEISGLPSSLPADGGNADTVDGLHGCQHGTLDMNGNSHGTAFPFYCRYNIFGDNRFGFYVDNYETRTHYSTNADHAVNSDNAGNADTLDGYHASSFAAASHGHAAASQSAAGLMSAEDKTKLDGIAAGANVNAVTGIKGNSEAAYRTGYVNLTAANVGAAASDHTHAYLPLTGGTVTGTITSSKLTDKYLAGNQGAAIINSTAAAGGYTMLDKLNSTNGYFTDGVYNDARMFYYTAKATVDAGTNATTKVLTLLNESGNSTFPGTVTASAFSGNASSATKATQDSAGQQINTTYIKGLAVNGRTITYTKGNGTTGTITTQDTNIKSVQDYSLGTSYVYPTFTVPSGAEYYFLIFKYMRPGKSDYMHFFSGLHKVGSAVGINTGEIGYGLFSAEGVVNDSSNDYLKVTFASNVMKISAYKYTSSYVGDLKMCRSRSDTAVIIQAIFF